MSKSDSKEPRRRAVVSLVIADYHNDKTSPNKENQSSTSNRSWRRKKKDVIMMAVWLLSTIYAILLVLFGIIFPASEALHNNWLNSYYNGIFLVYIYIVAIAFLIHLQLYTIPASIKKKKNTLERKASHGNGLDKIQMQPQGIDHSNSQSQLNGWMVDDVRYNSSRKGSLTSLSSVALVNEEAADKTFSWISVERLKELYEYEGSSFYLRLGALVFGIGNMIYIGLEIDYYMIDVPQGCTPRRFGWTFVLRLIFTLIQTFFLFKYSKVDIVVQENVARWGFMHIIATNLCVWIRTLVSEITHAVHVSHDEEITTTTTIAITTLYSPQLIVVEDNCTSERGLLSMTSPYLFPFVLEYSLIATGVFAIMSNQLIQKGQHDIMNKVQNILKANKESSKKKRQLSGSSDRDLQEIQDAMNPVGPMHTHTGTISLESSHKGMFIGILLLTGIIVSMVLFIYDENNGDYNEAQLNYLIADLCLHSLILIANIMAMYSLAKLPVALTPFSVDDVLLLISMSGSFLFEISILVSTSVYLIEKEVTSEEKTVTLLALYCSLVASLQTIVQAILLISGLRRYTKTGNTKTKKQGREAVTFLIVANVTAWIFRTVQVKELELGIQEEFYGTLAWLFILNLNLPLLLFYRFHSSVCFADIWFEAYHPVDHKSVISHIPPPGLQSPPATPSVHGDFINTNFFISDEDSLKEEPECSIHL